MAKLLASRRFLPFLLPIVILSISCQTAAEPPTPPAPLFAPTVAPPPPQIEAALPRAVLPGAILVLHGSGFGERGTADGITINSKSVDVVAWSDELIRARVPRDFPSGEATATVTSAGQQSNAAGFRVKDPEFVPRIREIPCHRDTIVCSVYLPPQYDREPNRRFPTVYHFQGSGWGNTVLPRFSNIATIAEDFGFIIVLDWSLQSKEEGLALAHEIDAAYRTIPSASARGMWLTSVSGRVGLQLATERPDVFGAVDGSAACVADFDPAGALRLRIRLDVGDDDNACGVATQRVHERLTSFNIAHEYEVYPGRHDMPTMFGDDTVRKVLNFFAKSLKAP